MTEKDIVSWGFAAESITDQNQNALKFSNYSYLRSSLLSIALKSIINVLKVSFLLELMLTLPESVYLRISLVTCMHDRMQCSKEFPLDIDFM